MTTITTEPSEEERPTIGTTEAARLLDMHPETIRTWVRNGRLQATKVGGRNKFRRTDIEAILAHPGHRQS